MSEYIGLIEGFIEELRIIGLDLETDNFQYRGFSSQGDGLSFDFKLSGIHNCNKFLKSIEIENDLHLYEISDIMIFTSKNSFGTHYCHEKTRNIVVEITSEDDVLDLTNKLEENIKFWYIMECEKFYDILRNHYEEVLELEEGDIEVEREEWDIEDEGDGGDGGVDIESVIVDRIDPDMDIVKIILMIEEAELVSNTIQEKKELIVKFIDNFKKDYIIIKRINS